ncbi:MAG: putative small secreted protein [Cycloclasticus sp.]|jgi:predicted small secreted protein
MKKTILLTFSVTLAATALAASLFLNTILGVVGLTATSISALQNLKNSQLITERMKKRHVQKKIKTTKRFATRSGKRVASTALAAATIGTVAVVATMTYLEVSNYCEDKQDLQQDANILYGTDVEFDLDQCVKEGEEDSKRILSEVKEQSIETASNAFDNTVQYSAEKWAAIKTASMQALQESGDGASELWDSTKSWLVD